MSPSTPGSEAKAVDPVCGAAVDPSTPYFANVDGEVVYFDSEQCLRAFQRAERESGEDSLWDSVLRLQDR